MRGADCAQENFYGEAAGGGWLISTAQHCRRAPATHPRPAPVPGRASSLPGPSLVGHILLRAAQPQPGTASRHPEPSVPTAVPQAPLPAQPELFPSVPHLDVPFTPSLKFGSIFSAEPVFLPFGQNL